jgi:hypothetical protein
MGVRQKKTREDVVVGKSCSGLGVLWWFFERMGGLKNHYRWLTSVCSSFGYFFFFPVLMFKILADRRLIDIGLNHTNSF